METVEVKKSSFVYPKEVIVKRIPKPGVFGIGAYEKSTTRIGVELHGKTGRYKTGLTRDEEVYFEEALRLPKGSLAPSSEWWGDIDILLDNNKANYFLIDTPMQELKYRAMLESSKIANSELEKHKSPNAMFFIDDPEAKALVEVQQVDFEYEAYELLHNLKPEEKRASLRLFGKKGVDQMSETVVKAELSKELKKSPKSFVEVLKDKDLKVRLFVEALLDYKILTKNGNYYKNGDDPIGNSTEEVIEYFKDIKNQSVKLALENKLKKASK